MAVSIREQQVENIEAGPRSAAAQLGPAPATPVPVTGSKLPVKLAVERGDGDSDSWQLSDLSLNGAFLHSGPLRQQGAQLQLALWLRDAEVSLEIPTQARVAWLNDTSHPKEPNRPTGMGVTFCNMEDGDLQLLSAYLNRRSAGSLPSTIGTPPPVPNSMSGSLSGVGAACTTMPMRLIGAQIGAYRIVEVVGSGGMADVFLAVHTQIGRQVALKKLNPSYTQDAAIVRRFFDEACVVNQIHHPNIIEITDFIVQDDGYYYVMELLDGPSLEDLFRREGLLPVERLLHIAVQLCEAIAAVHQAGVVHRDLKPANVMLIKHGDESDFVKLLDFGVAKLREPLTGQSLGVTIEGTALGTPGYMAPEQLFNNQVDERSDIYALGVILYRMITGRMPHAAKTPYQMLVKQANESPERITPREAARVPRGLVDLTMGCLNKDPAKRPQAAAELAVALRLLQAPQGITGSHEHLPANLLVHRSNEGWRWFAIGLGIAALIAVSGAWWLLRRDPPAGDPARMAATPTAEVAAGTVGGAGSTVNAGTADATDASVVVGSASGLPDGLREATGKQTPPENRPKESNHRARRLRNRRSDKSVFDRAAGGRAPSKAKDSSFFDQFSE